MMYITLLLIQYSLWIFKGRRKKTRAQYTRDKTVQNLFVRKKSYAMPRVYTIILCVHLYNPILKVLELGLGKLVSSVHGIKRRKAVSWERLGLGLKNRVVFRRNKRPYFLTITIVFSEKSFAIPQVYTIKRLTPPAGPAGRQYFLKYYSMMKLYCTK